MRYRRKEDTCPCATLNELAPFACVRQVKEECVQRVRSLGDMFGRDRMFIGTCAFGPASEDYAVLQVAGLGKRRVGGDG